MNHIVHSVAALTAAFAISAFGCDKTATASAAPGLGAGAGERLPRALELPSGSAEAPTYKVELKPIATYKKGQPAAFEVVLKTKGDFHVNDEYPVKFKPSGSADVSFSVEKLDRTKNADAFTLEACANGKDRCTLRIKVAFTPKASGTAKVGGILNFGVCNSDKCLIEKQTLEIPVSVT